MYSFCAMYSLRMSFWMVPEIFFQSAPCFSATTRYMAQSTLAGELMVIDVVTFSSRSGCRRLFVPNFIVGSAQQRSAGVVGLTADLSYMDDTGVQHAARRLGDVRPIQRGWPAQSHGVSGQPQAGAGRAGPPASRRADETRKPSNLRPIQPGRPAHRSEERRVGKECRSRWS